MRLLVIAPNDTPSTRVRPRVAFVSQPWDHCVPPVQDGAIGIWNYQIATRLARDCDVLFYARRGRDHAADEVAHGIHFRRFAFLLDRFILAFLRVLSQLHLLPADRPYYFSRWHYALYTRHVARDLAHQDVDIVHVPVFPQIAARIRRDNPRAKIVLHMHCQLLTQLRRPLVERYLRSVDLILTCSDFITDDIRRAFPQFQDRCHTVYNCVDAAAFARPAAPTMSASPAPNDAPVLLFVSVISPQKGLHVLLRAFQRVLERYPSAQLHVCGAPRPLPLALIAPGKDLQKPFATFYSSLDTLLPPAIFHGRRYRYLSYLDGILSPAQVRQVIYHSHIRHDAMMQQYHGADVFIQPSVWDEPFGVPVIEAMAASVPVIASRSGGMPELVRDGVTGSLVARDSANELANAILRLLGDPKLRQSMGEAGRQRALELFSWERGAQSVLRHYRNLLGTVAPAEPPVPVSGRPGPRAAFRASARERAVSTLPGENL